MRALPAECKHAHGHAQRLLDDKARNALLQYASEFEAKARALRDEQSQPAATLSEQAANAPTGEPEIGPGLFAATKPPEQPREGGSD
jgi:hypothetical protein